MQNIIRLSISEASKLFGISQRTVRRALAQNMIEYTIIQGRYKISFLSMLQWSEQNTRYKQKRDKYGIGQYVEKWNMNFNVITVPREQIPPSPPKQGPKPKKSDPVEPVLQWD